MKKYTEGFYKRDYDYEEDAYDRLQNMKKENVFTNKGRVKKFEFDYEEDLYEPEEREE